jgi:predicted ATP-grasp superfamily ATP-dependent carboligase
VETDKQTGAALQATIDPAGTPRLVIVGASARALAESAVRAGHHVDAADLFGDRDLLRIADGFHRAIPYPESLPRIVSAFPPGPWCYTGGLENHPDLIDAISCSRPLAGSTAAAVRQVRDLSSLRGLAHAAGLAVPETRLDPSGVPLDGSWLLKPRRSAGGHGIQPWRTGTTESMRSGDWLWQRKTPGRPWSAAFWITEAGSRLLGVSRQLVGSNRTGATPYHWCGGLDLDPTLLPDRVARAFESLGRGLATVPGLCGLVGIDLLIDAYERIVLLEVNPRPTASMELIERATGISLAAAQLAAAGLGPQIGHLPDLNRRQTWAKAILFTPRPLAFTDVAADRLDALAADWTAHDGWAAVADLPVPPQTIPSGRPVCTAFAVGPSPAATLRILGHRMRKLRQRLLS